MIFKILSFPGAVKARRDVLIAENIRVPSATRQREQMTV